MLKQLIAVAIALSLASSQASVLLAWGAHGHEIVARVAARKLTAGARSRLVDILRKGVDDDLHLPALLGLPGAPLPSEAAIAEALARMSTWPDRLPNGKGATGPWHYIDYGLFEGPETTADRCDEGCVTELITTLLNNIRAKKSLTVTVHPQTAPQTFRVDRELRFLVHFVGDIHQPLHAATDADAGGNCINVTGFANPTNLHSVWDNTLVQSIEKQTEEKTVDALLKEFKNDVLAGSVVEPHQMAAESFALARDSVYALTKPVAAPVINHFVRIVPPGECQTKAPSEIRSLLVDGPASFNNAPSQQIVRARLYKAGVRLANLLNAVFMP